MSQTGGTSKYKHIFVIGKPGELGDLFIRSAQTKILRYKQIYPDHQYIVIGSYEVYKNRSILSNRYKHKVSVANRKRLTVSRLVKLLGAHRNVKSLDFFSHSGAGYGIALEKNTPFKYNHTKEVAAIRKIFSSDGYMVINGCNSGFLQAPNFSKQLNIPVFGSLTSTDFHKLHSDGSWYNNNKGNYPEGGFAKTNTLSFETEKNCYKNGGCLRMKPDNHNYSGYWGSYKVGLPYYRPFCASGVSESICEKSIVNEISIYPSSQITGPSISKAQYTDAVIEYVCPQDRSRERFENCKTHLLAGISEEEIALTSSKKKYGPIFRGSIIQCKRSACQFSTTGSGNRRSFRKHKSYSSSHDQILVDFKRFMKAYDLYN